MDTDGMDFDEIDYLEKTLENPGQVKVKETVNGGDGAVKSGEEREEKSNGRRRKDYDNDDSRRSKPSRATDGDRDKRRSDRESKNRDVDGERSRDKEERNGRNRYRDRDQRKDQGYGHERDSERERDRSWGGRNQMERHRGNRDDKMKERTQEKDIKERDMGREFKERDMGREFKERDMGREFRERNRDNRKRKDKKEEVAEPEADPERDQRTVFVYQLSLKASERDLYEFFSLAGKVRDVRIIMDRISRRSRGVGYIEFYDAMSVPMAIALSGQPLLGQPIMVKPSEAEKNLVQSTATAGSGGQLDGGRRLYVGNLHYNIAEEQLRLVFEAFGVVDLVQLPLDETGRCKGYAFVRFARLEDAKNALSMNGEVELAGRPIKVSTVTDQVGTADAEANTGGDLDDYEGGGLPLSLQSRALLMQNLDRSGTVPSIPALSGVPPANFQLPATNIPVIDPVGVPSECLLLKNMFDPKQEMDPDFYMDIREDVKEECSKFGSLKHIDIDQDGEGVVYLRFENTQSASSAQQNLHGRWFAGKMITATFMVPQTYEHKFPDSNAKVVSS